jgi:hypothetical protein
MAATTGAEQTSVSPSPDGTPGGRAGSAAAARGGGTAYRHVRYDELVTFDFLLPLTREDRLIRLLFLELFAEAVVHAVEGEDEIWLVENGPTRRLYVWERA